MNTQILNVVFFCAPPDLCQVPTQHLRKTHHKLHTRSLSRFFFANDYNRREEISSASQDKFSTKMNRLEGEISSSVSSPDRTFTTEIELPLFMQEHATLTFES
jgi:hypothetical protein